MNEKKSEKVEERGRRIKKMREIIIIIVFVLWKKSNKK
jgi:hypothetical protein